MDPLITAAELARRLGHAVILDASWIYGPFNVAGIDVRARYADVHLPGAWFLDLAALSDPALRLDLRVEAITPPPPAALRAAMTPTGAGTSSLVVVTDMDGGCATAPLARYALIRAGYTNVRLLDGGTPAWAATSTVGLTSAGSRYLDRPAPCHAAPAPAAASVFADHEAVERALGGSSTVQLVDCRAFATNTGVLPPDYEDLAIPCATRIPSTDVVADAGMGQRFRPPGELDALAGRAGLVRSRAVIATCYFGVGAAVVATALEIAGWGGARVHAGSLVEHAVRSGRVRPPAALPTPRHGAGSRSS